MNLLLSAAGLLVGEDEKRGKRSIVHESVLSKFRDSEGYYEGVSFLFLFLFR